MDPMTKIFGIAVTAVTRLGELESASSDAEDTATDLKSELEQAASEAFSPSPSDLWKAYTLLNWAVGALTATLAFSNREALDADPKLARLFSGVLDAVCRAEHLAGLAPPPAAPTPAPASGDDS